MYDLLHACRYLTDMRLRIQQALAELEVEGKATTRQRSSEVPPPISMRAIAARAGEKMD